MSPAPLTWRVERDDDLPFVREVYASTRVDELAPLDWSDAEIDAFVTAQFLLQRAHYRANYPGADFLVLILGSERVGRLYVDRRPEEMLLIDIALLPAHRRRGLGGGVVRRLMDEAAGAGQPLRLSVRKSNPAGGLYRRLGFTEVGDHGMSWHMEWRSRHAQQVELGGLSATEPG